MKDVDFDNLKSLVEYMYKGEANVPQNMLASFIKTAESLQVRGLAECATKQLENEGLNASTNPPVADLPPAATSTPTSSLASKVRSFTSFILQLHTTPWPSSIKVFGEQWVNQWCGVSLGVAKVN